MLLLSAIQAISQNLSIAGKVLDQITNTPVAGAAIVLYQDSTVVGYQDSDPDGSFLFSQLSPGRYYIEVSFIGYVAKRENDIYVRSGNQTELDIKIQESSFALDEVVVSAVEMKGDAQNEFSILSAKTFSIDETERYAGTRGDPARMAANYAGVVGNNDNSNDIVVRGNTPIGLLWRMDGVNIPNPNHFAASGNSGGPVTILNNQILANSDFLTGAFASEYGNTIAGVFDLKTRSGNNQKFSFSGEIGFLGFRVRAEGPFSKNSKSSYLAAYRFSTLAAFETMNIDIGTDDIPYYQDLNIKLNFPLKNGGNLSIFAMGGTSKIDILRSQSTDPFNGTYGDPGTDEYFRSKMGVVGATYSKTIGKNTFLQVTGSYGFEGSKNTNVHLTWDTLSEPPTVTHFDTILGYDFQEDQVGLALHMKHKLSTRSSLKYGLFADYYRYNFQDSVKDSLDATIYRTRVHTNDENGIMVQPYINWRYLVSEKLTMIVGLHGQYFDVSNSSVIEPRLAFNLKLDEKQFLEFGAGIHSQIMPSYIYFLEEEDQMGNRHLINKNTDFMKSLHLVAGYNRMLGSQLRFKTEVYYQHLYNIPVTVEPSSYSILNEGAESERIFPDSLSNEGTGTNYGLEVTLEKFFSRNYFFMVTASIFNSDYLASDGQKYNTVFNSKYALNMLGAKEFYLGKKGNKKLTVGAKLTLAGGRWYTPLDMEASKEAQRTIYDYEQRNSLQFDDYVRFDVNLKYRVDNKKVGHEIGLDLVNLLDIENAFSLQYNSFFDEEYYENQIGFLPIFYYRLDF